MRVEQYAVTFIAANFKMEVTVNAIQEENAAHLAKSLMLLEYRFNPEQYATKTIVKKVEEEEK